MKTFAYDGHGVLTLRESGHTDVRMVGLSTDAQLVGLILKECGLDPFFNGPAFLDHLRTLGHVARAFSLTDEAVFRWHADRVAAAHAARTS